MKPKTGIQDGTKIKDGYRPHTDQCKDTERNIIGDKEQIEGRWKEHFEEILNENKRNSKMTPLDIEQYPMNTQIGEKGIQAPTGPETQLALQKLNSNNAVGIDGIPAELKHRGKEVINKIHKLVGIMWEKEYQRNGNYLLYAHSIRRGTN
jgi:hypothetical protein